MPPKHRKLVLLRALFFRRSPEKDRMLENSSVSSIERRNMHFFQQYLINRIYGEAMLKERIKVSAHGSEDPLVT